MFHVSVNFFEQLITNDGLSHIVTKSLSALYSPVCDDLYYVWWDVKPCSTSTSYRPDAVHVARFHCFIATAATTATNTGPSTSKHISKNCSFSEITYTITQLFAVAYIKFAVFVGNIKLLVKSRSLCCGEFSLLMQPVYCS